MAGAVVSTGIGGALAGFMARGALQAVDHWVSDGAVWMVRQVGGALSATGPSLGGWYSPHYRTMAELAGTLLVPFLVLAVVQAVARQDLSQLSRSVGVHLPAAVLFTAVAVELVRLASGVVDSMSRTVVARAHIPHLLTTVTAGIQPGGLLPAFVDFLVALVVAFGGLVLWLELIVRAAAVEAAVLFLPLALAGLVWPITSRWARRLAETLAALVLSKLVVAAVLSLGAGAVLAGGGGGAGLGGGGGVTRVVTGVALLMMAAFSPFALLRLIPMIELGAVGHLEGAGRRLAGQAGSALAGGRTAAATASGLVGLLGGSGGD
ncbi:MAG: hypothetical protein ACRD0J_10545, partial [Acidimicrobiales bacterium]